MGVKGHNDLFIINDVELSVPPTEISIQKEAANFEWQTLRTRNAQKVKSGHGIVHISFTTVFVGLDSINDKLRRLICQLRLTPICYVENSYLRQHLLPTESDTNMALILKSMAITVRPELVDTITVHFEFGWFNYLPYIPNFKFKRNLTDEVPRIVTMPSESDAWKQFYQSEFTSNKYSPITELKSEIVFEFDEFKLAQGSHFKSVEDITEYINSLREIEEPAIPIAGTEDFIVDEDTGEIIDTVEGIISPKQEAINQTIAELEGAKTTLKSLEDDGFSPVDMVIETNKGKQLQVFSRHNKVTCNQATDLIPTGITIVFENIVAALPILGHQYSTYQHIGSIDPKIIIKLAANTDEARSRITRMWDTIEENAIRNRQIIKQEMLNLYIINSLLSLCGLTTGPKLQKGFITDSLGDETIPGQPGTYSMTLALRGTDFSQPEKLEQEFVTFREVRNEIIRVLNNNIRIDKDIGLFVSNIPATDSNAAFASIVNDWIVICNKAVDDITGFIISRGIVDKNFGDVVLDFIGTQGTIDLAFSKLQEAISARRKVRTTPGIVNTLRNNIFPATLADEASELGQVVAAVIRNPGTVIGETSNDLNVFDPAKLDSIQTFLSSTQALTDGITLDGRLDLEEFKTAKQLADKMGAFKGRRAYPDFPTLSQVASTLNKSETDIDPDFYFFNPILDKLDNVIDPALYQTAVDAAQKLYVPGLDSKNDFYTKLNSFFENIYLKRIGQGTLKNEIIKAAPKQGGSIKREVSIPEYDNAAAGKGREVNRYTFKGKASTMLLPDGKTARVVAAQSLSHSTEPSFIFDNSKQTVQSSDTPSFDGFTHPITPVNITSGYGPRNVADAPDASKFHLGIDYGTSGKVGLDVKASKAGNVIEAGLQNPDNDQVGFGNRVWILHDDGFSTAYAHLSEIGVKVGDRVTQGQVIGKSGGKKGAYGSGTSTGPHLHFEIVDKDGIHQDPAKFLGISTATNTAIPSIPKGNGEGVQFGNSLFARSVESLATSLVQHGQVARMVRAYPTFKLYFVEEDTLDEKFFGFDDFFSYNAVKSIRVVRSRKIPADLCVIELTNVSGILSNRKFRERGIQFQKGQDITNDPRLQNGDAALEDPRNGLLINTADENPLASLMLKEGTKINLRLGYSNDPDKLETVFVGQITEVEFSETDDLVTIVCQSYATELAQQLKGLNGIDERGGLFLGTAGATTGQLLSDMIQQPEVLHFGRWRRSRLLGIDPTNTNLDLLTNRFEWLPAPQDDNIFPPLLDQQNFDGNQTDVINFLFDPVNVLTPLHITDLKYYIYRTTIWDIFKEMELRHPGCVSSPVPYVDAIQGPRMTMFFGLPNQLYFARDPSLQERRRDNLLVETIRNNSDIAFFNRVADVYGMDKVTEDRAKTYFKFENAATDPKQAVVFSDLSETKEVKDKLITQTRKANALADKSIRPFRSYHVLTSGNHIISNNIRASALDVYNTVSLEYTAKSPIGGKLTDIAQNISNTLNGADNASAVTIEADRLTIKKQDVITMKADAALPDNEVQEVFLQYPSCEGDAMAEYYCLGALRSFLRDIYKGEIAIIGNPAIKPYDICYLFDEYSDIVGPVEVEQVVHYFSQESGFVTEITPDMCVTVNEWSTLCTTDSVGLVAEGLINSVFQRNVVNFGDNKTTPAEAGAIGIGVSLPVLAAMANPSVVPLGLLGAFVTYKLIQWSKFRHPVTLAPLLYKGKPLVAAMGAKSITNSWFNNLDIWFTNGLDGISLTIRDLSDRLVLGPSTGSFQNFGLNTKDTQF